MSDTAVLVVDMMNTYQHPDAEDLIPNVGNIIEPLADLVRRARESDDVDLVYVNDNYSYQTLGCLYAATGANTSNDIDDIHVLLQTLRPVPLSENSLERDWDAKGCDAGDWDDADDL